jgi:hypothetical protein
MRWLTTTAVLPLLLTGCTSVALERHTLSQVRTVTDMRFQQVMDDLAATAADPAVLPAYAPIGEGISLLQDTFILDPKTLWQRMTFKGFAAETVGLTWQRQPQPQWTVDPASEPPELQALHCACLWAVYGPPPPDSPSACILTRFQVIDALRSLPPCWLGCGKCEDVPANALYRAHCRGTWIWVTPDGMAGLSAFTLIIQDIATVSISSLDRQAPAVTVAVKFGTDSKTGPPKPTAAAKAQKVVAVTSDDGLPGMLVTLPPALVASGETNRVAFKLKDGSEPVPMPSWLQPPPAPICPWGQLPSPSPTHLYNAGSNMAPPQLRDDIQPYSTVNPRQSSGR